MKLNSYISLLAVFVLNFGASFSYADNLVKRTIGGLPENKLYNPDACVDHNKIRTNKNNNLPGSYTNVTCRLNCFFNGTIVPHGQSVVAYRDALTITPDTCGAYTETRICKNGNLSGSFTYSACQTANPPLSKANKQVIANWVASLQYTDTALPSYGAIKVSNGISAYEDGTNRPVYRITPYFTHLGLIGLIEAGLAKDAILKSWIVWYLDHLDPTQGVPLDTWYGSDGTGETVCPVAADARQCNTVDAVDSSAALLFVVIEGYLRQGGDASILTDRQTKILTVINAMTKIIDASDGLSIAKQSYPIKYTLDNAEVYAGLVSLNNLTQLWPAGFLGKTNFASLATRLAAALDSTEPAGLALTDQLYSSNKDMTNNKASVNLSNWYPDFMAQIWPMIFNTTTSDRANRALGSLGQTVSDAIKAGDCNAVQAFTASIHEPVLAYALKRNNDPRFSPLASCIYSQTAPTFAWPFHVGHAGWLIRN